MAAALPRPSGRPNMPGKFSKICLDNKLFDAKEILKKYPLFRQLFKQHFSFQKMGVALPRSSG